jgi:hypothetical protein
VPINPALEVSKAEHRARAKRDDREGRRIQREAERKIAGARRKQGKQRRV